MAILIDGYNLLHMTGILSRRIGPGTLQRAREALIHTLARRLTPEQANQTTIVFDAKDAPPDRPAEYRVEGLTVRFATEHDEADTLLEEMIRADSAPKRLTVVSSDRRVRQAAMRRKAQAVDSLDWYTLLQCPPSQPADRERDKPNETLTDQQLEYWLAQFSDESNS